MDKIDKPKLGVVAKISESALDDGHLPVTWEKSGEEAVVEALQPIAAMSALLEEAGWQGAQKVDPINTSRVFLALVERAQVILGTPKVEL